MKAKWFVSAGIAATLSIPSTGPVRADGDALVGGIIGGIIGGAIVNEANKGKKRTGTRTSSSGVSSATREANREVQVALNHFGFPVGTPDGALGPKSRAAIGEFQALLGYPPTGQLSEYERTFLVGSYHRAIAGGALTLQQAAAEPLGMRGLLVAWRNESLGVAPAATAEAPGTTMAATDPNPFADDAAPEAATEGDVMAATATDEAAGGAKLPTFMGAGKAGAAPSLASLCNKVSLRTSTNGGYTTLATLGDPMDALSEQFCLARGYSIALSEDQIAGLQGFSPADIEAQCAGMGPAMAAEVAAAGMKPAAEVMAAVWTFAGTTGMAPDQLASTARICLGVGYKTDKMDVALASALILGTMGEGAYAELVGHHLAQGFGTNPRPDLALDWFLTGVDAAQAGQAVFAPDQDGRLDLVRKAALIVGGRPEEAMLDEAAPAEVPLFEVPKAAAEEGELALVPETTTEPLQPVQSGASKSAPAQVAVAAEVTEHAAEPLAEAVVDTVAVSDGQVIAPEKIGALPLAARLPFLLFSN
jgi:peptidoglycan hydrolase-like protein with peptidoglycan-binding domain